MSIVIEKNSQKAAGGSFIKGLLYFLIGWFTYPGINYRGRLKINGMEKLRQLPDRNVLFVSNHQTYFVDVITLIHIFCAARRGRKKSLGFPFYLFRPFTRIRYVAAATTMSSTLMSRIFTMAGAVTVKRAWNASSGESRKGLELSDTREFGRALENNWVINFPQGTTTPFAPGRKGTAFIIRQHQPIVIPIVIKGFSEAFRKTGLSVISWKQPLEVTFKDPMVFDEGDTNEAILQKVMIAIEQVPIVA